MEGAAGSAGAVVGVLGPVVLLDRDGATVRLGSSRQRRLLAALALHAGADVDCDRLAELVWGAEQPADPDGALRTNVARLRRLPPAPAAIGTGPRSYRLDVLAAPVAAAVAGALGRTALAARRRGGR